MTARYRAAAPPTLLLAAVLAVWAVVTPAYRGPDEPQHLSTILRLASDGGYPPPAAARMDRAVLESFKWVEYRGRAGRTPVGRRPATLMPPSMETLRADAGGDEVTALDQMTQHPPAYYGLMAAVVRLLGLEGASPQGMILVLRLLSAALLLPIPLLTLAVANRFGLTAPAVAAAAYVPVGWIAYTHIGATINNGTLLVLASSAAMLLLLRVVQGDFHPAVAALAGAAVAVALLTKGFALALLPTLLLAGAVAVTRTRSAASLRAVAVACVCAAPGVSWWVLNVVRYGEIQPSPALSTNPAAGFSTLQHWVPGFAETLSWTMWGALGWAETRIPLAVHVTASVLLLFLLCWGTVRLRRHVGELAILHSVWLGSLMIVAYGSAQFFLAHQAVRGVHGRYLHLGVITFAVLAVAAAGTRHRLIASVPVLSVVVATLGLVYGLRHFWVAESGGRIGALLTWWPGGAALLLMAAFSAMAAVVWGTIQLLTQVRQLEDDPAQNRLTEGAVARD